MNETETPRSATYRVDELRPHPSYIKHQLSVPAFKISALDRLGKLAFQEPITITTDGIIIDGYARWELAKLRNLVTIRCLAYQLTEDEALCYLLLKQRRSDGLNDFRRIELAFDLEPSIRENARANQQAGGRAKGSSTLTTAERVDRRKKIAQIADVSVGNVTKVRKILSHACSCVQRSVAFRMTSSPGLRSPKTSILPSTLRPVTTSTHSAFPLHTPWTKVRCWSLVTAETGTNIVGAARWTGQCLSA